jgi:hypothetical protein
LLINTDYFFNPSGFNTVRLMFLIGKNTINHYKDAINRRLYNNEFFVETAIHRVSCLNRIVLRQILMQSAIKSFVKKRSPTSLRSRGSFFIKLYLWHFHSFNFCFYLHCFHTLNFFSQSFSLLEFFGRSCCAFEDDFTLFIFNL